MKGFLAAVELRAWRDHEERIDSTPGKALPKGGEGRDERSPHAGVREARRVELVELADKARELRLQGLNITAIAERVGKTERQVRYAERLWERRQYRSRRRA